MHYINHACLTCTDALYVPHMYALYVFLICMHIQGTVATRAGQGGVDFNDSMGQ